MKKILIFLSILFFFTFFETKASSFRFEWDADTTRVEIPLGDNLQNYLNIPKAILYRDNEMMSDADIQYITTGDWLYLLTDVDTNKVGSYQVWYKAIERKYQPGQCQGYKTLITFIVVDSIKPVIKEIPSQIYYYIGSTKPNYENQIVATDNSGNYFINIDESLVNYDKPGEYPVWVRVSDGYNITEEKINVIVEDSIGPVVTFLGDKNKITLLKGEEVNLQKYFKAVDKIDGDVTGSITYPSFNVEEEGRFNLEVSFFDSNNNKSSVIVEIEILDKNEPMIELARTLLILNYDKPFVEDLESNIKQAFLGKEDIRSDIEIHSDSLKNQVGSYFISYVYNKNGKYKEVKCEVKMLSSIPPILLIENAKVRINEKLNALNYVSVTDPSDEQIASKITYDDSSVDYTKEGTYSIFISVTNSSGLTATDSIQVTVYSSKTDLLNQTENYIYLVLFIIISIVGVGIYIYIRKKRNCNKEQNTL